LDKTVGTKGIELNNSNNDNYRGDVYDDDYSDGAESLAKYRVLRRGARVLAVSLRLGNPSNQTQQGCQYGMLSS
jgi:hypothetical protein